MAFACARLNLLIYYATIIGKKTIQNIAGLGFLVLLSLLALVFGIDLRLDYEEMGDSKGAITAPEAIPAGSYKVLKITDGDTIQLEIDGEIEKIRLIGIDAPETAFTQECFGKEATAYLKQLLTDQVVEIEFDPTQAERDKYGRLLLYIFLDGVNINQAMIAQGYAHEYTYNTPYKYQTDFVQAEKYARENNLGLWGDACSTINN